MNHLQWGITRLLIGNRLDLAIDDNERQFPIMAIEVSVDEDALPAPLPNKKQPNLRWQCQTKRGRRGAYLH
jgi:hypothetical protein